MRDARAHARLSEREYRRDGRGARFLCRERQTSRRQYLELLSRSAPSRLVRDAYTGQSAGEPRARMERAYRRRVGSETGREDQRRNYREWMPDAGDARAAFGRAAGLSVDGAEG